MRLLIYSMPFIAVAMMASNYSTHLASSEETRTRVDPQAIAISKRIWGAKLYQNQAPQVRLVKSVFEEE